ncbi:22.7 kDa class IV heat shock protein-like [Lycium ferocissimum]|uniref:22.7 kDa class IV heat shock protein-like n=1 Tax=Lycium ferocissimum TaxID=112874 RepID=UPI002815E523|nr:22.7 kDa class IV heat shock protein-like [Lycium ferocissimum]
MGAAGDRFEPSYEWLREQRHDLLLVHLPPEFKDKEGLKVRISSFGGLKISGDRRVNRKRLTFFKEFSVWKNYETDEIQAEFEKGVLTITLPKKITKPNLDDDKEKGSTEASKESRLNKFTKVVLGIAAAVLVVTALTGFAYYTFTFTITED